ncbi:hypothetical protein N7468_003382 [Penicillium chermesinum]|uniref:glutathione transferase n=1 Tax=Penicillium chermesinum TaxID=63820 RepID=A0A9W9TS75_9EURO|nr:uncharacterized protein N7468_003382 [Penicillium chermesinum]KAJ5238763.1 hypothetical protein N7468_003382 [Penicillium chermesinum]KAJ6164406.1 hypothetical protein N7470_003078 [Penicillium chermesinum]
MSLKPIVLYGHSGGPNPWKVVNVFHELNLPYEHKILDFKDIKAEPYVSINPNGRVPAIEDPNTGISLWESGAILEYLVETYDKDKKISFAQGTPEYFQAKQWLHFQMSGQGPYFGQAVWFANYHPEKLPSAIERYNKEIRRVCEVLNGFLAGKEYLVGNKFSYVDLAFIPWFKIPVAADAVKDFPNLSAWLERITSRPAAVTTYKEREEAMAKAH